MASYPLKISYLAHTSQLHIISSCNGNILR
jgi:hypothetical protein